MDNNIRVCVYKCDVCGALYPQEGYASCSRPCHDKCISPCGLHTDAYLKMVSREEARWHHIQYDAISGSVYSRKYVHDCTACIYLGSDEIDDFYFCKSIQGTKYSTLIARHSDEGPAYTSFEVCTVEALNQAHRKNDHSWCLNKALNLAKEKGLCK